MRHVVLDASVVGPWFWTSAQTRRLLSDYQSGQLAVTVPHLLLLELLNVAGRRHRWSTDLLIELVDRVRRMKFELLEPEFGSIARWTGQGLTAYDANYVALAEELGVPLVTGDAEILRLASDVAVPI